ncbi:MAG: hypothetical protein JEZ06_17420 [Anaerolineaceae bacterium]|nr:hypothetical protein [Anaerolineaceae bacterium]
MSAERHYTMPFWLADGKWIATIEMKMRRLILF